MQQIMWGKPVTSAWTIYHPKSFLWPMRRSMIWVPLHLQPHLITLWLTLLQTRKPSSCLSNMLNLFLPQGLGTHYSLWLGGVPSVQTSSLHRWPAPGNQLLKYHFHLQSRHLLLMVLSVPEITLLACSLSFWLEYRLCKSRVLISLFLPSPHGTEELLALTRGLRNVYMCVHVRIYYMCMRSYILCTYTHVFIYIWVRVNVYKMKIRILIDKGYLIEICLLHNFVLNVHVNKFTIII